MSPRFALKPLAAAALLGMIGAANASFITYDTAAAFGTALTSASMAVVGIDTFSNLASGSIGTSVSRTLGSVSYTATGLNNSLYNAGGALSTTGPGEIISLNSFSKPIYAIGANFFNTLSDTSFAPGQALTLTVVDAAGSHGFLYSTITSANSFFGIVSTVGITGLYVASYSGTVYPTIDNLQLAVPEPETYALMLAGLGVVAWLGRRKQKSAA